MELYTKAFWGFRRMGILMKNIFTFFLIMFLTSCAARLKPSYDLVISYDESAPPEWKLGWQQGCESGLSAYGNDYYKTLYKFKQDVSMVKNEYYFKAWNDSFNYCRASINRSLAGDYKRNEDVPALFSSHNLDITTSGKRDIAPIVNQSVFGTGGKQARGAFADMFDVKAPGYGSMSWGSSVDKCDWLNRCGDDKPKDPMDALMGH